VTLVHALAGRAVASLVTVAGRERVRDGIVTGMDPRWAERAVATGARLREWRQRVPA
jgi:hypothetical protein